jgi:Mn-dependent DtxR family transcriptional regulator
MQIRESGEDYLETILLLHERTGAVRSIDISNEMGFSKPSVSVAMKKLRDDKLINVDNDGYITLTDEGKKLASGVYDRHSTIHSWLVGLGVSDDVAEEDACRMEHIISEDTFQAIKKISRS